MTYPNAAPAAAWYPDPQTPGQVRWWDGTNWTEHVSVPAPAAAAVTAVTAVAAAPQSITGDVEPEYIGRHAAGAKPAPRQEPTAPRIRPRASVALTVDEPLMEFVYA